MKKTSQMISDAKIKIPKEWKCGPKTQEDMFILMKKDMWKATCLTPKSGKIMPPIKSTQD